MNFLRLRRTPKLAVPKHETEILFADADGVLKQMAPDGSVSELGAGGGSTPAGSDGEVQFNDGGDAFGASPFLAWDDATSTLTLGDDPNGSVEIACDGVGVELFIAAADGDALSGPGGEVNIKSGDSVGNNGGDLTIEAGSDQADGTGGNVTIKSGHSAEGDGGEINIYANQGVTVPGTGGQILVHAGTGVTHGGDALVQGGAPDGSVQLYSGNSDEYVQLDNNGLHIGATKLGFFQGSAVAQPGVPVTLGDVIAALQALGLVAS